MHVEEGKDDGGHLWRQQPHHETSGLEGVHGT